MILYNNNNYEYDNYVNILDCWGIQLMGQFRTYGTITVLQKSETDRAVRYML